MVHYYIELAAFALLAYVLGCILGAAYRKLFSTPDQVMQPFTPVTESVPQYMDAKPVPAAPRVQSAPEADNQFPLAMTRATPTDQTVIKSSFQRLPETARAPESKMVRPKGLSGARGGKADDLQRIVGVGPKYEKLLHNLGFYHYDQIAEWSPEQVSWVDDHLGFDGRIEREEWVEQARLLRDGDDAQFTKLYGSGGIADESRNGRSRTKAVEDQSDDLLRIVGIGPKNNKLLNGMGITRFAQIAEWTKSDIADVEERLEFDGRIEREEWIKQARLLADGNDTEFQRLFGGRSGAITSKPKGIAKARGGKADDLQRISGIGPKNEKVLHSLGFFHFDQIAAWTKPDIAWIDDHLNFNGRIEREEWVRQAALLADGKDEEFAKLYGTGGLKDEKGETRSGSRTRKS